MTLPDLVNGSSAERDRVADLLRPVAEKEKQRHRGMTYNPLTIHDRAFSHQITIDDNSINETTVIHTSKGDIVVHSPSVDPPTTLVNGVDYFLRAHSKVRDSDLHESGVMVAMGERVDYRSSTITKYVPNKRKQYSIEESNKVLLDVAITSRNYICGTPLLGYVEKDLLQLSKKNSAWVDNSIGAKLHPTYAASEDLTNSPHYDNDCGRGFAIFFRTDDHPQGVTCLVFPMIGLIIKCYRTAIISWVGNDMMHCSVSTDGGLRSLFMASNHRPVRHHLITTAFRKKGRNKDLQIGTLVVVRHRDVSVGSRRRKKKPFKYINARIIGVTDNDELNSVVVVRYECNKKVGVVSTNHVCKAVWIQKVPTWRE